MKRHPLKSTALNLFAGNEGMTDNVSDRAPLQRAMLLVKGFLSLLGAPRGAHSLPLREEGASAARGRVEFP